MKKSINNLDELKWEIARLTGLKHEQEAYLNNQYSLLKDKVDKPAAVVGTLLSNIPGFQFIKGLFSGPSTSKSTLGAKEGNDWMTKVISIGLPILLNRTFLKNSGWIKKSLVVLLSQTAASQVTQENVSNVLSKITNFIKPKVKRDKRKNTDHKVDSQAEELADDQILGI